MIRWLTRLLWGTDSDRPLDFVPVQRDRKAQKKLAADVKKARERHGKPFRCQERVPRETEPSRDLIELNNAGKEAPVIVLADRVTK